MRHLYPILKGVADFYTSYSVYNATYRARVFPYTCAQETCNQAYTEHHNHQDVAYAVMAYTKLLEYTDPMGPPAINVSASTRAEWSSMLRQLAPFPTQMTSSNETIWAEADTWWGPSPSPDMDAGYSI